MAGVWNWLFRRRKSHAVAELPRTVPSGGPTSVQIAKQLVARAEPAAQAAGAEPAVEPVQGAPVEPAPDKPDRPFEVGPESPDTTEPEGREISTARLDQALRRLREEIPATEESTPSTTPVEE